MACEIRLACRRNNLFFPNCRNDVTSRIKIVFILPATCCHNKRERDITISIRCCIFTALFCQQTVRSIWFLPPFPRKQFVLTLQLYFCEFPCFIKRSLVAFPYCAKHRIALTFGSRYVVLLLIECSTRSRLPVYLFVVIP